ncbi:MAG TPA: hypothetical protein VHA37_01950 [Candidatus Saccharimonadales bacterium]|nr:hypothetical protein [Candidatus Saccharimonadales bacterium]
MGHEPRKQEQDKAERTTDQLSEKELIELAGGQRKFNEKFFEIFGEPKKQ